MDGGSRLVLFPTYQGQDKAGMHIWRVEVPKGGFESMGCSKIPPYTGIEWIIPGLAPWRHP
jgi:hypothetical protein